MSTAAIQCVFFFFQGDYFQLKTDVYQGEKVSFVMQIAAGSGGVFLVFFFRESNLLLIVQHKRYV